MTEATEITIKGTVPDIVCDKLTDAGWVRTSTQVPEEMEFTIYVNLQEVATVLCTPTKLNCLTLGFLYSEGVISGMSDVVSMRVCETDALADVLIKNNDFKPPTRRILTSGCGGGTSFEVKGQKVESALTVSPADVLSLMKQFQEKMELYRASGGVHASALADAGGLLVVAEDIGRHNTLDKILGECLLRKIETKDKLLMTTGRVSSEMLSKATRMQTPVVISRSSPTSRAVAMARELGVTLVGYVRANHLTVYSHPQRLGCPNS